MNDQFILQKPLMSEKNTFLASKNTYVFKVTLKAKKPMIKRAVEKSFRIKVDKVRTLITRKQYKKNKFGLKKVKYWKKAFVKLKPGEKIPLFEGK